MKEEWIVGETVKEEVPLLISAKSVLKIVQ